MKIEFSVRRECLAKCLDTCIYYKCCSTRSDNNGIIYNTEHFKECPMLGSIIEPKFEDYDVTLCGEETCHSMTHYHCYDCSASMPMYKCSMMDNNGNCRPSEDCPMFGMPSGQYEIELKKENFQLIKDIAEDCRKCNNLSDDRCKFFNYTHHYGSCSKFEENKNED